MSDDEVRFDRLDRLVHVPKTGAAASELDVRSKIERDYGRVLHSGAFRRLQSKSQVVPSGEADFFRTRLTHTLEVAQIARALAKRLPVGDGTSDHPGYGPTLAEVAALVHDLGHPPFGHNGEDALKLWMERVDSSFEANAQSLRIVAALEIKYEPTRRETVIGDVPIGLNLTMETLAACLKYPWPQHRTSKEREHPRRDDVKFGYYHEEEGLATLALRSVLPEMPSAQHRWRRHAAAEIVDWADDVAYSVHDLEDGIRGELIPLSEILQPNYEEAEKQILKQAADHAHESAWPDEEEFSGDELQAALSRLEDFEPIRRLHDPYRHEDAQRGLMKEMTTALIDRFAGGLKAAKAGTLVTGADLHRDRGIQAEMTVLKAMNWKYVVMGRRLQTLQYRERRVVTALADAFLTDGETLLPEDRRPGYTQALELDMTASHSDMKPKDFLRSERARLPHWDLEDKDAKARYCKVNRARVVCDYVAGMTDPFAERSYARIVGAVPQSLSDYV